jgi:hypothetical protein
MDLLDFVGDINLEESAALEVEVAIADIHDILTFPPLPTLTGATENGEYVDLAAGAIVFETGKCFKKFTGTLEKNGFASELVGPKGALSFKNTLTIARSAMNKGLLGFLRANRNRELIVAFKPLGGTQYVILGWKGLPAMFEGGNIDVPAEIAGEKMTSMQIVGIFYPPLFIDTVSFTPAA